MPDFGLVRHSQGREYCQLVDCFVNFGLSTVQMTEVEDFEFYG